MSSFVLQAALASSIPQSMNFIKGSWIGWVPLGTELLVWLVHLGKLNSKDHLRRLNIIREIKQLSYPFCNNDKKTINHFFFLAINLGRYRILVCLGGKLYGVVLIFHGSFLMLGSVKE